jgi:hypothetical protein
LDLAPSHPRIKGELYFPVSDDVSKLLTKEVSRSAVDYPRPLPRCVPRIY